MAGGRRHLWMWREGAGRETLSTAGQETGGTKRFPGPGTGITVHPLSWLVCILKKPDLPFVAVGLREAGWGSCNPTLNAQNAFRMGHPAYP